VGQSPHAPPVPYSPSKTSPIFTAVTVDGKSLAVDFGIRSLAYTFIVIASRCPAGQYSDTSASNLCLWCTAVAAVQKIATCRLQQA
jgi:hypothetical protein